MTKQKNKLSIFSEPQESPAFVPLEPSAWMEFLSSHIRTFVLSLAALAVLLMVFYRWAEGNYAETQQDYLRASQLFVQFEESAANPSSTDDPSMPKRFELEKILLTHPELQAKYDAALAQVLISSRHIDDAQPHVQRSLKRTLNNPLNPALAPYGNFAETSLIIGTQQNKEALQKAIILKDQLQNSSSSELLFAFNLLRIALLAQQLQLPLEEKETWNELQKQGSAYQLIKSHLHEGNLSIQNYIEGRLKFLEGLAKF